jgi:hypothetical protein
LECRSWEQFRAMMRPKLNSKQVSSHLLSHNKREIQSSSTSKRKAISKPIAGVVFENIENISKITSDNDKPGKNAISETPLQEYDRPEPPSQVEHKHCGPKYTFNTEIPEKYDDLYICVLPRDPQWLYVYWEFPDGSKGSQKKVLKKDFDSTQLILRVKETPSELQKKQETYFDVPISVTDNNWYVKIPEAGCNCVIEYGQLSSDGSFTAIASTSHFTPPSDSKVKKQSLDECLTTQSQQLIDFTCDTSAVQNITRFHDRSKTIPAGRSNKETSGSLHPSKTTKPVYGSNGQEIRYFGSAVID